MTLSRERARKSITYSELLLRSTAAARVLTDTGVGTGDRLAGGGKQVMPSFAGRIPADELGTLIDFLKAYPTSKAADATR